MSWEPFVVRPEGRRAPEPRSLNTAEGLGDRLRTAAFAELQAREAFRWAAARFSEAPEDLRAAWRRLAEERGRAAEESFQKAFAGRDPVTADIFRRIAEEEILHIAAQAEAGGLK